MTGWADHPEKTGFYDLPGSYHHRAGGFSFVDGHAEIKRWRDNRTMPPLDFNGQIPDQFSSPNNPDIIWLQEHTTLPEIATNRLVSRLTRFKLAGCPTDIKSLTREELEAQFKTWEQPAYRVTQLLEWLYVRRVTTWEAMTNLPKKLRSQLSENYSLQSLELVRKQGSRDITQKFLWKLADGAFIESVLIPANPALYGEASDRHTLCISTQVGCAYGCKFCASGLDGWKRNLNPNEIVEQVLAIERWNESESKVENKKSG
ncbi:MAG: hypothetical protein WDM80_17785 [Limisphaerales bacterium]